MKFHHLVRLTNRMADAIAKHEWIELKRGWQIMYMFFKMGYSTQIAILFVSRGSS